MTANGKAVSHEAALMEYAITKDRAEYITSHGLQSNPIMMVNLEASEILAEFRQHRVNYEKHTRGRPMGNPILRFELCPTTGETLVPSSEGVRDLSYNTMIANSSEN